MTSLLPPSPAMQPFLDELRDKLQPDGTYHVTPELMQEIIEQLISLGSYKADHKAMHDWIKKHSCEKPCEKDRNPNCYSCQSWNFLESLLIKP